MRDQPGNRNAAIAAERHRLDGEQAQAGRLGLRGDERRRMAVAQRLAEDEPLAVVALGGEGEGTARRQEPARTAEKSGARSPT